MLQISYLHSERVLNSRLIGMNTIKVIFITYKRATVLLDALVMAESMESDGLALCLQPTQAHPPSTIKELARNACRAFPPLCADPGWKSYTYCGKIKDNNIPFLLP